MSIIATFQYRKQTGGRLIEDGSGKFHFRKLQQACKKRELSLGIYLFNKD